MPELDLELDLDRLRAERNAWLCTLRRNGSPHVTPVWYVFVDGDFWISSGERNAKVRNVINDPRVSVALDGGDHPYVAEGRAVVHRDPPRDEVLAALAQKYDGWQAGVEIEPYGKRVLINVPVDRWLLSGAAQ